MKEEIGRAMAVRAYDHLLQYGTFREIFVDFS